MKKRFRRIASLLLCLYCLASPTALAASTYIVQPGDSLWKIAVKYQIGLSEIISSNPQFKNPNLIYPGDKVTIPSISQPILDYEAEVIRLTNVQRANYGLAPLQSNWELSRVARYKSQDMHDNNYFSHTSPVYGDPFKMIRDFGISFRTAGENIAKGYTTPQAVVNDWMNSSGHRANILNAGFTQIGVGYVANGNYWTQMFIG